MFRIFHLWRAEISSDYDLPADIFLSPMQDHRRLREFRTEKSANRVFISLASSLLSKKTQRDENYPAVPVSCGKPSDSMNPRFRRRESEVTIIHF